MLLEKEIMTDQTMLAINYTIQFEGVVWKQFLNETNQYLIIEERHQDELKCNFHCIDLAKESISETIHPSDDWWETIAKVSENELSTTLYGEQNAENKGENLYPFLTETTANQKKSIHLPSFYNEETQKKYFEDVKEFLSDNLGISPLFAVEYLEYNELIIISYYIHASKKLENHISIFNSEDGNMIYTNCIGTNLNGIAFDTFFVVDSQLIFIKNLRELINIQLTINS